MGFSNWISGLFGSKSSEENKDNEDNIERSNDVKNEVYDQVGNDIRMQDKSEIVIPKTEEQEISEIVVQQDVKDEGL